MIQTMLTLTKLAEILTDSDVRNLESEALRELYDYNPDTGNFFHKAKRRGVSNLDKPVGTVDNDYSRIRVNNKLQRAHRMAWMYENGPIEEGNIIDHIDHNKLNNALENLRSITKAENSKNLSMPKNNTSGTAGVYLDRDKWRAKVVSDNKANYLGTYADKIDAIRARSSALKEYGFHDNHGVING